MPNSESRAAEVAKYKHVYSVLPNYRMGEARMNDAILDLAWGFENGARSYLDIGCGRGEMLKHAENIGYSSVLGVEAVADLCIPGRIGLCAVDGLGDCFADESHEMVTSFDVIEHLLPGDDELLLMSMSVISAKCVALTANNLASVDPTTGADLHINKRPYDEWDSMIRDIFGFQYDVIRCDDKQYVSETWRCIRKGDDAGSIDESDDRRRPAST